MSDSTLALISTLAWIALVGVVLGLFGRTEGGGWSIAGGVARGVREWAGHRRADHRTLTSSPTAEVEDHGERPSG